MSLTFPYWQLAFHDTSFQLVVFQIPYYEYCRDLQHLRQSDGNYTWGTGIRGLMRGMTTLTQGNQELLVVRDKVGRTPGELGVSKSMECDIFPLQCFDTVGWATGRASGL